MTDEAKVTITVEEIIALMDKSYSLYYVDYNDSLEHYLDKVQDAIHGDYSGLDDIFMDWDNWGTEKEYLNQLQSEVESHFEIDEDEAHELVFETHFDRLRDEMCNRDDSTPLKDLLRNTGDVVMFYDTGAEIGDYTYDFKERLRDVKQGLKIALKDKSWDEPLGDMINNASYGGRLVVYFSDSVDDYINLDEKENQIEFSGYVHVAIIDNGNGSGADCEIGAFIKLPFTKENLFIDKCVSYSYTYEVCGMSSDWCASTNVAFSKKRIKKLVEKSSINNLIEQNNERDKVYKSGKCTTGDMNIKRHRNTHYINDFPCGTKCLDCGTFWID